MQHQQSSDTSFIDVLIRIRKEIQNKNQTLFENNNNICNNQTKTNDIEFPKKKESVRKGLCISWHNMTQHEQQRALSDFVDCEYTDYTPEERKSIHIQLIEKTKSVDIKWNGSFISHIDNLTIDIENENKGEGEGDVDASEKKVHVCFIKKKEETEEDILKDNEENQIIELDKSKISKTVSKNESLTSMRNRLQLEKGTFFAS